MSEYAITGGAKGSHRLNILSEAMSEVTTAFLGRNRTSVKGRCLDLGCGNGHVTRQIAEMAAPGSTVEGWDIDAVKLNGARSVQGQRHPVLPVFKQANAFELETSDKWDFIYARFLFSHLDKPSELLGLVFNELDRGGVLLIEDTDFSGHFCHPASKAFNTYVEWYSALLARRGANADIGRELFNLVAGAGFEQIDFQIVQPAYFDGPGKLMAELTLEAISPALETERLATASEIQDVLAQLRVYRERPDTVMSLPRIFQLVATVS